MHQADSPAPLSPDCPRMGAQCIAGLQQRLLNKLQIYAGHVGIILLAFGRPVDFQLRCVTSYFPAVAEEAPLLQPN